MFTCVPALAAAQASANVSIALWKSIPPNCSVSVAAQLDVTQNCSVCWLCCRCWLLLIRLSLHGFGNLRTRKNQHNLITTPSICTVFGSAVGSHRNSIIYCDTDDDSDIQQTESQAQHNRHPRGRRISAGILPYRSVLSVDQQRCWLFDDDNNILTHKQTQTHTHWFLPLWFLSGGVSLRSHLVWLLFNCVR